MAANQITKIPVTPVFLARKKIDSHAAEPAEAFSAADGLKVSFK